ncbi:hypothetical protein ACIBSW_21050 [Actinoplanes sp. NPDC049668]|uniref:hypothetical protein n=1 Tax=unclassified Actinoplanes TaxID=2626549 RepID=UPI0033AD2AF4
MRSLSKTLLALLVGLASVLATAGPAAASTPPRKLGGLDLGAYCRSLGNAGAVLAGPTAYDWHCAGADGGRSDLTFDAACRWTYATGDAVDRIGDFRDPASVECWLVSPAAVAPDFGNYCTSTGHSSAELVGTTVYDWRCVRHSRGGPTYFSIDVAAVCRKTTGVAATVERFVNYYDARTWQCRV